MYGKIFYLILVYIVIYILYCLCKNVSAAKRTNPRSSKKTQEYITRKVEIENNHCNHLPLFDSEGRAYSYGNSWNDKTGKFSSELAEELNHLNKEYNMPTAKKNDKT